MIHGLYVLLTLPHCPDQAQSSCSWLLNIDFVFLFRCYLGFKDNWVEGRGWSQLQCVTDEPQGLGAVGDAVF